MGITESGYVTTEPRIEVMGDFPLGPVRLFQVTIHKITLTTQRELPMDVRKTIEQWARHPAGDLVKLLPEYAKEAGDFQREYNRRADLQLDREIDRLRQTREMYKRYIEGDRSAATVRAQMIQAESLQKLAEIAESVFDETIGPDGSQLLFRLVKAVEHLAFNRGD